uniref:Ribonuclease H-like domain, reverse transcriptase, RNA-dependent DNA polymerase n=1 Tax=Tanacetum cinerariifolium TaxID=118510 RepID=A0A6L2NVQ6_TANCI|nr:ribonuclease H-like domain, reverse transcriptase, RNA-dependent DNA polymerase [Tanacetum cinerariifolium]
MKMEQYLTYIDYALCEVILNGNEGLDKGYDRFQRLLSLLEIHGAGVSTEDVNQKFIRSLPSAWSNISLIMRNKPSIENLDIDDLYNNLKVYEADIKGSFRSSSNLQIVAFVFAECTSSTNELNVAYSVSIATCHSSQVQGSSSYADELMFSFFANQSGSPQLDNEDLEQIDLDDLEEVDLKWQAAMLFMRVKRIYRKTRRKLKFNGKEPVDFDKIKVECFNYQTRGHFARDCRIARNPGNRGIDAGNARYRGSDNGKRPAKEEDEKTLVVKDGLGTYDWSYQLEEEATEFARMAFTSNHSSSSSLNSEEEATKTVFDNHSSDKENSLANDRFKKGEGFHTVPPPLTGNYMPPKPDLSFAGLDDSIYKFKISETITSLSKDVQDVPEPSTIFVEKPKEVRTSAPLIQEWDTNSDNDSGHPQQALKNKGIVNSGCYRHMTWNKAYLADYQEINDGCFVAFGLSRCKITGKEGKAAQSHLALVTKHHNKTPYELLNGISPRIDFMRPFGYPITILNTLHPLGKFEGKADKGFLVGYSVTSKAFRDVSDQHHIVEPISKPKDDIGSKTIVEPVNKKDQAYKDELDRLMSQEKEASDATDSFRTFIAGGPSSSHPDAFIPNDMLLHVDQDDSKIPDLEDNAKLRCTGDPQSVVQTKGMAKKSSEAHAFVSYIHKKRRTNHKDYENYLFACFLSQMEPKKVAQALDDESWVEAMQDELLQFSLQNVWRLVDLPYVKKAIRTKWVYRNKKDERGIVVRNKARLVAQGHIQKERIDYNEVFALVARIEAIRIFLAFASFMRFIVYQMDVKSAFLYDTIEEEVYVSQPHGFLDPQFPNKVYKVEKALYGLHQAPRACYMLMIIFGSTKKSLGDKFEALMHKRLQINSMEELTFFLGLQVKQTSTPIETQKPLVKDEEAADVDVHLYRSMIRSLMYLKASRPDIMFVVYACSRFQVTPKLSHLYAVKRIFRYLKGNPQQEVVNLLAGDRFHGSARSRLLLLLLLLDQSKSHRSYSIAYLLKKSHRSYSKPGIFFAIQYSKPENPNELFQKLLEDLKELAEYENSQSRDRPIFFNDDEVYSDQNKECLENNSNEIATSNSNGEKEEPPQDSDIRKLIREECCVEASKEQKQNMEDTMLELIKICQEKELLCINDNVDDLIEIAPILSTKEPEYSSSMGYEHSNTTSETESDEIIKSGVEELVSILSKKEVTLEDKREYDVPISENSPICDDHFEIFSDVKDDDDILVYDDFEDIEYVEASLSDPEIVSVEEENDVNQEEEDVDFKDISQIQDVVLHEKLLSITRLIYNIESLNDNPTPDCVLNSFKSDNSLSNTFSPEFKTFCDHMKETRSGNTTHADNFLPEYDSFCFEIEPDQKRLIYVVKNDISDESSNDSLLEEFDLFLGSDNLIPPGIENVANHSEGDIHFLEELLIDDSILSHESSDSNFKDNPSIPRF